MLTTKAHIDEFVSVSFEARIKTDFINLHGEFAKDGWNYREAYFRDFDGKYYKVSSSLALGTSGIVVYNVGGIKERDSPKISGSSNQKKVGAPMGSLNERVAQLYKTVKRMHRENGGMIPPA